MSFIAPILHKMRTETERKAKVKKLRDKGIGLIAKTPKGYGKIVFWTCEYITLELFKPITEIDVDIDKIIILDDVQAELIKDKYTKGEGHV